MKLGLMPRILRGGDEAARGAGATRGGPGLRLGMDRGGLRIGCDLAPPEPLPHRCSGHQEHLRPTPAPAPPPRARPPPCRPARFPRPEADPRLPLNRKPLSGTRKARLNYLSAATAAQRICYTAALCTSPTARRARSRRLPAAPVRSDPLRTQPEQASGRLREFLQEQREAVPRPSAFASLLQPNQNAGSRTDI